MSGKTHIVPGGHLSEIAALLRDEPELVLVYDRNVAWVAEEATKGLPVRLSIGLETSEEGKSMETVLEMERRMLGADLSRRALLLAVGGGITTDLAGFAAAIYKRGIRYANLPTTLLAQVDAAIGGKTGVNLDGYKNMLGAFRMPAFTFLSAELLRTLPEREFRAGLAELLKTFLIADAAAYAEALQAVARGDRGAGLSALILRAAEIKAGIVERDPFEQGERAVLNLGHSFGHAIESASGHSVSHGEAVAMGMVMAAGLSERLGVAEKGLQARLVADFSACGLPSACPFPPEALMKALAKDKKAAGGSVKFVLPVRPGEAVLRDLPLDQVFKR